MAAKQQSESWDNSEFEVIDYSCVFTSSSKHFARAALAVGPEKAPQILLGVSALMLFAVVSILMIDRNALIPAGIFIVLSIVASSLQRRWADVQMWWAERSSLAHLNREGRARIVITPREIVWQDETGELVRARRGSIKGIREVDGVCVLTINMKTMIPLVREGMSKATYYEAVNDLAKKHR